MENKNMYDLIIVGGGPAGLSAAIYMARAKYKVLVLEKEKFGGQITITSEVVNYPGIFKTSGAELTNSMRKQAESFGAEFKLDNVLEIQEKDNIKILKTTKTEYSCLSVILAVGASPRKIGFTNEENFAGRGVAYCATCDGEFFTGKDVYVVGGGFAAAEESVFLCKYAKSVTVLVRGSEFSCAQSSVDELLEEKKVTVHYNTEVVSVDGENFLTTITYKNKIDGKEEKVINEEGIGVFVFAGYTPSTNWLENFIELDNGYIKVDKNMQTNIKGIYASGDVCPKDLRQVVTATSDGALAATSAEVYTDKLHKELSIPDFEVKKIEKKSDEVKEISEANDNFIDEEIKMQLEGVFKKFDATVNLTAFTDSSNLGLEMKNFIKEFDGLSEKIICSEEKTEDKPYLSIKSGEKNLLFYCMPGGHEFNSFIIALYNMAGPGTEILDNEENFLKNYKEKTNLEIVISLTCTMCPELVRNVSKVAAMNKNFKISIKDIQYEEELKTKNNIMSVPCMIINNEKVLFGKKNIEELCTIFKNLENK